MREQLKQALKAVGIVPIEGELLQNRERMFIGGVKVLSGATMFLSGGRLNCTIGQDKVAEIEGRVMKSAMLSFLTAMAGPQPVAQNPYRDINNES